MHIMYFFVITLNDPQDKNRILCKIGYTSDLIERFKSLEYEYKCKFYLLGMKTIKKEQDEKKFHQQIKKKFPEFVVNLRINNHDKDETYVFDKSLYETFLKFPDMVDFNDDEIELEKEVDDMMNNYFNNMDNLFELELIQKITKIVKMNEIVNTYQKEVAISMNKMHYDYLILKESNKHIEVMKDKEIELKRLELEFMKCNKK